MSEKVSRRGAETQRNDNKDSHINEGVREFRVGNVILSKAKRREESSPGGNVNSSVAEPPSQ